MMKGPWTSRALVVVIWFLFCSKIGGVVYKSIVWSPTNPIFVENMLKCVLPKSRLTILCPSLPLVVADAARSPIKENLYENAWLVDHVAYDSCNITKQDKNNRRLLLCDTPLRLKYYTVAFIQMSPTVDGIEFEPGKDYYLIATSDGTRNSLSNTNGGHCRTSNMKLRFHMCNDTKDPHCLSEENCQQLLTEQVIYSDHESGSHVPKVIHNHTLVKAGTTVSPSISPPNVPNDAFPPNSQYMDASKEVHYRLGIGLLVMICLSLLGLSAYLGYRLHRKQKQLSTCIENRTFVVRMSRESEGADTTDGDDSSMLIARRNSGKI